MHHLQGIVVVVRGETKTEGMQQYREHDVRQNPALWDANVPENSKYGDKFISRVSQVAFEKFLEQEEEPAEVTVHFLKDLDWHDTTVARIKIRVSDGKGGHHKWQVDLSKATIEREPVFTQKLPSLPSPRKTRTESSATWKVYPQTADQGSITVFVARGNWGQECNDYNSAHRSWITSKCEPTKFYKRSGKHGVYLCFEFQVRRKGYPFPFVSHRKRREVVNLGESLSQSGEVVKLAPQTTPAESSSNHLLTSSARSLFESATPDHERIGGFRPAVNDAECAHMNQTSHERSTLSYNAITQAPFDHPDNHMSHAPEAAAIRPDAGTRKRTASVAGLDDIVPVPVRVNPTDETTLNMPKPPAIDQTVAAAAHSSAASIEPMRERRGRAEPTCLMLELHSSTKPASNAKAVPVTPKRTRPATLIDLTDDDDVLVKKECAFPSSATACGDEQGVDDEDEEDLQLELRAIRTEQRLRALRKQKQRNRQAEVKTEVT